MFLKLCEAEPEAQNGWRLFLGDMYQNSRTDGWKEDDFTPDGMEITSPSMITVSSKNPPSVDIFSPEMGESLASAYASYMSGSGPQTVYGVFKVDKSGVIALEFTYSGADGEEHEDIWDYQGKVSGYVSIQFKDPKLSESSAGKAEALRRAFWSRGFVASDSAMAEFEEDLEKLRYLFSVELRDFSSRPVFACSSPEKSITLSLQDYRKAVMGAKPQIFLHW